MDSLYIDQNELKRYRADQKAKELYGPKAEAVINPLNGLYDIRILEFENPVSWILLGWGTSWEDAFKMAKLREPINRR